MPTHDSRPRSTHESVSGAAASALASSAEHLAVLAAVALGVLRPLVLLRVQEGLDRHLRQPEQLHKVLRRVIFIIGGSPLSKGVCC